MNSIAKGAERVKSSSTRASCRSRSKRRNTNTIQDEEYFKGIKRLLHTLYLQGWKIYCTENEVVRSGEWQDKEYLTTAHLILLLVSGDFLSSPFCYCDEMRCAVSKHGNGVFVVPILVEYAEAQLIDAPFGCLDPLPGDRIPIANSRSKKRVYDQIFAEIKQRLRALQPYLRRR
jgi:hypothetical protein